MPLASFLMTAKNRMQSDIIALCVNTSNTQDRIMHARSLAGYLAQSAIFTSLSIYIGYQAKLIVRKLMGRDDDDEEKKEILKKQALAGGARLSGDLISPLPPLNPYVVSGINMIAKKYQGMKEIDEKEMILLPEFEDNQKFGLAGVSYDRITTFYDIASIGMTGEYTDDYGNKRTISQEDQDFIFKYATIPAFANIMGLLPGESSQFVNNVLKTAKKDAKTEKKESESTGEKKDSRLGIYKNRTEMKRYDPQLYEETYGKLSPDYDQEEEQRQLKREQRLEAQRERDIEMGYTPKPKGERKSKGGWSGRESKGGWSGRKSGGWSSGRD
ncbi:MAG: hypothetical protein EBU66_15905 [Bacteroidetes bacterium]|nr:hypothetical protein [Bacteroidota bacterium]